MAKTALTCWVYEKTERLPEGNVVNGSVLKTTEVRLAFERDVRLATYPDSFQLRFVDEKAAKAFQVGQRYQLTLESI